MNPVGLVGFIVGVVMGITPLQPAVRVQTTVQVAPPPATMLGPCNEWAELAFSVGWPVGEWPTISRVMWCESMCQPTAYHSRYGASGLMQVLARYFGPGQDPFDPATNLAKALEIRQTQGWRAWSCF